MGERGALAGQTVDVWRAYMLASITREVAIAHMGDAMADSANSDSAVCFMKLSFGAKVLKNMIKTSVLTKNVLIL